jgi:transcriptional regulator with XRE-family HTH domain
MGESVTTLGGVIRSQREVRGLTLRAVAEAAGISAPYLSDVEHNRRGMSEETAEKIARFTGLDVEWTKAEAAKERARSSMLTLGHKCPRCGYPGPERRRAGRADAKEGR